ncbi:M48 family metallopeptidase [Streptomyces sp. TRM68416]|uniref:M48 family metallopeptidase n=1 Tax=Streptomyces sp. TRM68416 TaxID=2758412 RepID=UPI001661C196|nr:M48 family metallopeptidase [Streptomyces sp. TRM68416]MBD0843853.1 M48 family metallopeptidase [Streptomyces sp. TRM68416]
MTGGLAAGGTLLIVFGWETIVQPVMGLFLICLAATLRPHRDKVDEERLLRRADAPRLFALLDEIAESVGTRGFDAVQLTQDFAISAVPFGLRGRRLDIGLALWETLTPQQRIACLTHEVGRFTTGDVRHNLMVRTVLPLLHGAAAPSDHSGAMREQALAASPVSRRADEMAQAAARFRVDSALSRWGAWLVTWPQKQMARLVQRLAASAAEEAEFRSDGLAARVASTEAAVQALECRGLSGAVTAESRRLAVEARTFSRTNAAEGLWRKLAAYAANVSGRESPHDDVRARIGMLREAAQYPAMVTLDHATAGTVERELEPAKRAVAERFIREGTGTVH